MKDFAYIKHDKDTNDDGSQKADHIHLMLRFNIAVPTTAILAKVKGVCELQHLQKMQKWDSAIAYLTHSNRPDKHQYSDDEVYSNFDWKSDRDKALKSKNRLSEILALIDSGTLREYNYFDHMTMDEYVKYKRKIEAAFQYRKDRWKGADRNMECIFITGESGCGKTTYAKRICTDRGFSYYVSSGSNDVLDDYAGQDAIILDDLRPSCMKLSDLLKMLDNNTASSVISRFKNKVLECKMIIITTTLSIENFFGQVFENENESRIQLMRRCGLYVKMNSEFMYMYVYDDDLRDYTLITTFKNPISFASRSRSPQERIDYMRNTLGAAIEGLEVVETCLDKEQSKEPCQTSFEEVDTEKTSLDEFFDH